MMPHHPNVFLSYAEADRRYADRLRVGLEAHGCVVIDPATLAKGPESGPEIEEAVRKSDHVVMLLGKHRQRDSLQELEWQAALEARWEDPNKRLIPVLLGEAEVPNFLRGTVAAGNDFGVKLKGLREVGPAAEAIADVVRATPATRRGGSLCFTPDEGLAFEIKLEPAKPEEWKERFEAIERYAEEFEGALTAGREAGLVD